MATSPQVINALKTLDVGWARTVFAADPRVKEAKHEILLGSLHKLRFECADLPPEYRQKSRDWLEARGIPRMKNMPWPAPGAFP